jgi:hypothetical protein
MTMFDDSLAGEPTLAADDHLGDAPVALLCDGFWRRRFGGSLSILGRIISVDRVWLAGRDPGLPHRQARNSPAPRGLTQTASSAIVINIQRTRSPRTLRRRFGSTS